MQDSGLVSRLSWLRLPLTLVAALVCLLAGLQFGRPFYLAVGSGEDRYIKDWRADDEVVKEGDILRYYRWALDESRLRLPIIGYGADLRIRIHAHRHEPGEVALIANYEEVFRQSLQPAPWRDFVATVPERAAERGPLSLVFLSPSTSERLALAVDWLDVTPGPGAWILPSRDLLAAYLFGILLLVLASERWLGRKITTFVVIGMLAAVLIGLIFWKIPTFTLVFRMWPLLLFLWLASFVAGGLRENRPMGAAFFLGMMLQGLLYFHPYLYPPDLHYHFRFAEKLQRLSVTEIYRVSVMYDIPGELSLNYPYSPVFHLVTGLLSPAGADLKYVEKLVVLVAYGVAGLCLAVTSRRLGLGALPLVLYFLDPTVLRHLYRCHMPGMFGLSLTAIFMLILAAKPLPDVSLKRLAGTVGLLVFAMCSYPASFLQLSIFLGLLCVFVLASAELRSEWRRLIIVLVVAYVIALALFYGRYIELIWKFMAQSRLQVAADGRSASITGTLAIWWRVISLEKAWPFYIPAIAGMVLMLQRVRATRWRAFETAWALTWVAQVILTSDYLLPSVRVHIKEMAFLTPLLLLWEGECFARMRAGRSYWRIAGVALFMLLVVLSIVKIHVLVKLGFAWP